MMIRTEKSGGRIGMARLAALALSLVLAAPTVASASHHQGLPLLFSGETDRGVWISHRITTDGATVAADIEAFAVRGSDQIGGAVYDDKNHLVFGFMFASLAHLNGVYVDMTVGEENVHVDMTEPDAVAGSRTMLLTMNPEGSPRGLKGTFKALMWFAGTAERVAYSVRGEEGAAYHGSKSGDDTFIYTSRDFSGSATVGAGMGLVGARANLLTSRVVEVEDTLVGSFGKLALTANLMTVEWPGGSSTCDPTPLAAGCNFWTVGEGDPYADPAIAGTYTFNLSGAGVAGGNGEVYLAGADARIPVEADLALSALRVEGLPPSLTVGEEVQVTVSGSVANHGPWAPMDAAVDLAPAPASGITVVPNQVSLEAERLGLGETREGQGTVTIRCHEPGTHAFTLQGRVSPADPVDIDPNPANDTAQSSFNVVCEV